MKNLARSGEERANADCHVKNPARCGEEKAKEVNFPVKEQASCGLDKEANVSDNRPVKKQAEATSQQMCRPGKQNSRDGSKNSDDRSKKRTPDEVDSLPLEKQVEVAFEETRVVQESKSRGSDKSMSSPQTNNAQYRSRSNSPFVPAEKTTSYHVKEPDVPTFKSNTYQGSYMARSDGHNDAIEERNNPLVLQLLDMTSSL